VIHFRGTGEEDTKKTLLYLSLAAVLVIVIPGYVCGDCISNIECGIGFRCVKAPYSTSGACMKLVDEFGIQQYDLPRLDSGLPRLEGDCPFDTDCPIGFRCHMKYKTCVK
jgi:hypothetical protein